MGKNISFSPKILKLPLYCLKIIIIYFNYGKELEVQDRKEVEEAEKRPFRRNKS